MASGCLNLFVMILLANLISTFGGRVDAVPILLLPLCSKHCVTSCESSQSVAKVFPFRISLIYINMGLVYWRGRGGREGDGGREGGRRQS